MIALCPTCWRLFDVDVRVCPSCGADLTAPDSRSYTEKLIAALAYPEAQTITRVAAILARRAPQQAVGPLTEALRAHWRDPFVAAAILEAVAQIRSPEAERTLLEGLGHPSIIVRAAASKALLRTRDV
jgi:HEAT repeat protein